MAEFSKRKKKRLENFDYGQNGYYFVTLCTHNRQHLFQIDPAVGNDLCVVPCANPNQTACDDPRVVPCTNLKIDGTDIEKLHKNNEYYSKSN